MTNTSIPRRLSSILTRTSPSLKRLSSIRESGMSRWWAIAAASLGFAFPARTLRLSSRTILLPFQQIPPPARPLRLVHLVGATHRQPIRRYVLRNDRSGRRKCSFPQLDWRDQSRMGADEAAFPDLGLVFLFFFVFVGF